MADANKQCCPKGAGAQSPAQHLRRCSRCCPNARRRRSFRAISTRSQTRRDAVRSLEAHPEARPPAIEPAAWRTGSDHAGSGRPAPASARQAQRTPAANCRGVHRVSVRSGRSCIASFGILAPKPPLATQRAAKLGARSSLISTNGDLALLVGDFCNKIRPERTSAK